MQHLRDLDKNTNMNKQLAVVLRMSGFSAYTPVYSTVPGQRLSSVDMILRQPF